MDVIFKYVADSISIPRAVDYVIRIALVSMKDTSRE